MKPITDKQKRMVRILFKKLGWNEEDRTEFMRIFCKINETKPKTLETLSIAEASKMIQDLNSILSEQSANYPQMATAGQVKFIVGHWKMIDYDVMQLGDKHLHAFLQRRFGVTSVYDLTKKQASGAIAAIRNMEKRSKELAIKKAVTYAEQQRIPPMTMTYVTLEGHAMVAVAEMDGKVKNFRLSLEDNGRLN